MKFKDYYRILGVAATATADEIKAAYRTQARKLHPDVNKEKDAHQRFTDVGEAYEALSDPQKRAAYDQLRQSGFQEGQEMDAPPPRSSYAGAGAGSARRSSGSGFGGDDGGEIDIEGFSDFFQSMFGSDGPRGRGRRTAFHERGEDVHHALPVTLEEAYRGGERTIQLQVPAPDASGRLVRGTRTLTVKIPAGVIAGSQIRLRGQGMPGSRPEDNGDLYLEMQLEPHPLYRADGRDIRLELPIAPWEAALGASVQVPTLGGPVAMTIPAGSQGGQTLRLRGRGLPGDAAPGDQLVTLAIAVPATVSERAKALYRDLAQESGFNPRARMGA